LKPKVSQHFFQSQLFWSLFLVPFLAIPIAIVFRRQKDIRDADVQGKRARKANKMVRKYLSVAKKELGQKETFYISLEKALHNYLKAKLYIETSDLSKERIAELLQQRHVKEEQIQNFKELLENCELARYTPSTEVAMKADYDKAAKTISLIDKQMR